MADVKPRGYAATAAEFLDVSAEDTGAGDLAVRQLAAMQAIGYALLALGDQLADLTDASADHAGQLGEIADYIADLSGEPLGSRVLGSIRRLARRACPGTAREGDVAGAPGGIAAALSGPGKNVTVARYADQWLREHPGAMAAVYDLKDAPEDAPWDLRGGQVVPLDALRRPACTTVPDADAVIVRQALADAAAWRAWKAEGANCADCARLDPGRCAGHAADDDLAAAYEALRGRMAGGVS